MCSHCMTMLTAARLMGEIHAASGNFGSTEFDKVCPVSLQAMTAASVLCPDVTLAKVMLADGEPDLIWIHLQRRI